MTTNSETVKVNHHSFLMEVVASYMDDELREQLHSEIAPCDSQFFVDEYCKRHFLKFNEEFEIN